MLYCVLLYCFVMMQRCFIDYNIMVFLIILFCNTILLSFALLCCFVSHYIDVYYYNIVFVSYYVVFLYYKIAVSCYVGV